ncbi:MAG: PqqD family protein [Altererythrobacter sp.]
METLRKPVTDLIETDVDDETIIVQLDKGELFSVEGSARAIWRELDRSPTRKELLARLASEYGVDPAAIAGDVDSFLKQARNAGLVTS